MQLNLFDWNPNSAAITLMPWSPKVALVRETAIALHGAPDAMADEFWNSSLRAIADPLLAAGISHETIRRHLFAFRDAVAVALDRLDGHGPDGDPGFPLLTPTTLGGGADSARSPANDNAPAPMRRAGRKA